MHKQLLLLPILLLGVSCSSIPFFGSNSEECADCTECAEYNDASADPAQEIVSTLRALPTDIDPAPPAALDILNFTVLDGKVAGGGAISAEQVATLPSLGYTTIINLQYERESGVKAEIAAAEAAGITYISIPLSGGTFTLTDAHTVAMALEANPGHVLFHCRSGGRVSAVWALTRAINEGLSPQEAMHVAANEGCRPLPDFMIQRVGAQLPGR